MFRKVAGSAIMAVSRPTGMSKSSILIQPARTTMIFRRKHPEPLPTELEDMPKLHYLERLPDEEVYIMEENTNTVPKEKLEVLLLKDVPGIGMKWELAKVKKGVARNTLFPLGLAIYASPENLEKYKLELEEFESEERLPMKARLTITQLKSMVLRVPMNANNPWTLNKKHVRVAFRKAGVEVQESCITMPKTQITEPQEITVQLTMNKLETFPVTVTAIVYHLDKDATTPTQDFPPVWSKTKQKIGS